MDKERIKDLKWFLSFLAADLRNMKVSEYERLGADAVYHTMTCASNSDGKLKDSDREGYRNFVSAFIFGKYADKPYAASECIDLNYLLSLQQSFRQTVAPIFNKLEKRIKGIDYKKIAKNEFQDNDLVLKLLKEKIIKEINNDPDHVAFDDSIVDQEGLVERLYLIKESIEKQYATLVSAAGGILARYGNSNKIHREIQAETILSLDENENTFVNREVFKGSSNAEILLIKFIRCLHMVPISAFYMCPECSNWFVNVYKKEKIYCSNRCAARYLGREKRKEQKIANSKEYQLEKEAGKKRAEKSYEKRVKKKYPNAKIKGKPTKHKEE